MIVGILGLIGSGKNTAAEEFVKLGYEKDSFAASLKDACSVIFGWDRELLEGITNESRAFREVPDMFWHDKLGEETLAKFCIGPNFGIKYFTPRLALQMLGTNVFREHFHENIWLDTCEYRLQKDRTKNVVISDCRFINEIDMIRRLGGVIVQVERGERPDWYDEAAKHYGKEDNPMRYSSVVHPSEWDWVGAEVDYTVNNNGTLSDLKVKVNEIANDIRRNPGRVAAKNEKIIANIADSYV